MATHKETTQSNKALSEQAFRTAIRIRPVKVPETHGDWLFDVDVQAVLGTTTVGMCRTKLIKESEYDSPTKHFFSAMDDQSNTMGDLTQLVLWSEERWVSDGGHLPGPSQGPWEGMEEYGGRIQLRELLDREMRENKGKLSVRKYCNPVLYRPSEGDRMQSLAFPARTHWLLLFTDITVAPSFRGRNIDRVMVRKALAKVVSLARDARRPVLAAVEPGCVQFQRFYISDRAKFLEWYGPFQRHWPAVQRIKARQEKFWSEMGFQKFEKPRCNRDLSNFFFWSGLFELPERKDIDLTELEDTDLAEPGKELKGLEDVVADGSMIVPEKENVRRFRPIWTKRQEEEPQEPLAEDSDRMDMDDGGDAAADKRTAKRDRAEYETALVDQRPEKRYKLADDMEVDPVEPPQSFEATDQIGEGDIFNSINWAEYDSD